MKILKEGSKGKDVRELQKRLKQLGFNPGAIDGEFGPATGAAVIALQRSEGLLADGIVGPRTARILGLDGKKKGKKEKPLDLSEESVVSQVTTSIVSTMFPQTPIDNIKENLPFILQALEEVELVSKGMVLMGLATIRAETESFEPISEFKSKYNTSPGGHRFDLYDNRKDLGNQGIPDGERFRGRGFIQLTGRDNYKRYGKEIGLDNMLIDKPGLANNPGIAAKLLAHFIKSKEIRIKEALLEGDLKAARRLVNGGSHGLDRFSDAFRIGQGLIA